MELNQYLDIFLEESKEHLQQLNEKLLLLENESNNTSLVNDIFRSAHTLKGMAATMGYENMATLTHEMENLLDLIRNNKKVVDATIMDTLFHSVDALEQMLSLIINQGNDKLEVSNLTQRLQEIASGKSKKDEGLSLSTSANETIVFDEYERTVLKQSLESDYSIFKIVVQVDKDTVLKSARAYMVFHELEKHGEVLKSLPSVEDIENEDFGDSFTVVLISKQTSENIKKEVLSISEIVNVEISMITNLNAEQSKPAKIPQKTIISEENTDDNKENDSFKSNQSKVQHGKMIRVDIDRLDELMNLFSELVIDKGRLEQLANELKHPDLTDTVEHMSRISSSLQTNILNLRMVPIEQVFNRFPRMIRDLSKELNKKVNLNIIGADTELDRTVIDEIGDPLVHLLRNALDHGLETTEERKKAQKKETGEIVLKAYHSSNYVFIDVIDDGKGIDKDKVLKKALDRGIISIDASKTLTEKQIFELLFASGFSTADQISDISGRGVGLDVVKSKIETLGGFVTIDSELGKGTKFSIQLPLTLSIISSMLVKVEEEKYAIPLSSIIETAIIKKEKILLVHNQEVIDFRGRIVPLVYMKKVFDVPNKVVYEKDELAVVIVRKGDKMAALVVDTFLGQQEIVLKSLGKYLPNVFAISGATILGDGQVALIIDTNSLIK